MAARITRHPAEGATVTTAVMKCWQLCWTWWCRETGGGAPGAVTDGREGLLKPLRLQWGYLILL